jgi:hypothetical protein
VFKYTNSARLRRLGIALLHPEVVILFVSGVAAVAAVFAWTGASVAGGIVAAAVVAAASLAAGLKIYALCAQSRAKQEIDEFVLKDVQSRLEKLSAEQKNLVQRMLHRGPVSAALLGTTDNSMQAILITTGLVHCSGTGIWQLVPDFEPALRKHCP